MCQKNHDDTRAMKEKWMNEWLNEEKINGKIVKYFKGVSDFWENLNGSNEL